jgi:hypothetical protein
MDADIARDIASKAHAGQLDRRGEPMFEHLARVAAVVPPHLAATAWLHDVLERTTVTAADLRAAGLTSRELDALELLSRRSSESYELHVLRIAHAEGDAGDLARIVKLADLDDHISAERSVPDAPPYRWARRRIESLTRGNGRTGTPPEPAVGPPDGLGCWMFGTG